MDIKNVLFPRLNKADLVGIPSWEEQDFLWSILDNTNSGLIAQIMGFEGAEDGVFIHPSAVIGEFVTIEGPCYVGAGAEIRHSAYLRKGSWICQGAVVGHSSEIKNSILLPESKAPHFNYVGDSILGVGVNLGAGAKLSNVRNDSREIRIVLEDGGVIDTGLKKLGAIIGDGSQIGCNVVTNPGTIIKPGVMVNPNSTLSGFVS